MPQPPIVIHGLKEFRADCRRAQEANVRDVTKAIKVAGVPVLGEAKARAPHVTGELAGSAKLRAAGTKGAVTFEPKRPIRALVAEFSKKPGWQRYGSPPRFAYAALEDKAEEVFEIMTRELQDLITIYGWARP